MPNYYYCPHDICEGACEARSDVGLCLAPGTTVCPFDSITLGVTGRTDSFNEKEMEKETELKLDLGNKCYLVMANKQTGTVLGKLEITKANIKEVISKLKFAEAFVEGKWHEE